MEDTIKFLTELRKRLLQYFLILGITLCIAIYFSQQIYHWLALPLLRHLPNGSGIIATAIPAPFLIPFKSALFFSIFITTPILLFQLWRFVAPGLYTHEKRFLWPVIVFSSVLFYLGVIFAYFFVLPVVFKFFIAIAPAGVEVKPDISLYYSFIIRLFFAFGFAFEVPILIIVLMLTNICSAQSLQHKRPYIIVLAFVVGMLLTPPDIISQIMLAIPLWLLYELGIVLGNLALKSIQKQSLQNKPD